MNLNNTKTRVIILLVALSVAFEVGRQTAQVSVTKTTTQEQSQDNIKEVIRIHTVTVTDKQPSGVEQTTTTTDTTAKVKEVATDSKTTQETKTVASKLQGINASVLVAPHVSDFSAPYTYGIAVNKQVLGPFTIGAFALTNQTYGLSLGVTF